MESLNLSSDTEASCFIKSPLHSPLSRHDHYFNYLHYTFAKGRATNGPPVTLRLFVPPH
jgi:hypothetical protein